MINHKTSGVFPHEPGIDTAFPKGLKEFPRGDTGLSSLKNRRGAP